MYECITDDTSGDQLLTNASYYTKLDTPIISRQDLVFLETWHELVDEKDIVYPYGNVQYNGIDTDGLTGIANGVFTGADTYSLFGNWQENSALIGRGYVWSTLSQEDKLRFASNKDNNIYMSKDGLVQVRYRVRVIEGLGTNWGRIVPTVNSTITYDGLYHQITPKGAKVYNPYDIGFRIDGMLFRTYHNYNENNELGIAFAGNEAGNPKSIYSYGNTRAAYIPIALVQRRNQGVFDPTFNSEGTAVYLNTDGTTVTSFYDTDNKATSIADAFNPFKLAAGSIGTASGRPDGLFYDEINERDIEDLRMSAHKVTDKQGYLEEQFNKAVAGEIRGKEKEKRLLAHYTCNTANLSTGSGMYMYVDSASIKEIYSEIGNLNKHDYFYDLRGASTYLIVAYHPDVGTRVFKDTYAGNYYFGVAFWSDHSALGLFANKTNVDIKIFGPSSFTQNNTALVCDIIGDPRTLAERVNYTPVSGTTQTVNLTTNTYVKVGTTIYRSLLARTGVNLDPAVEVYTNTANWVSKGTNGAIGGYPQEWKTNGVFGTPLLTGENGESLLPADIRHGANGGYIVKLNRKANGNNYVLKKVIAYLPNGTSKEIPLVIDWNSVIVNGNSVGYYKDYISNQILFNINGDTTFNDDAIIQVFYETKANATELTANSAVEAIGDIYAANNYNDSYALNIAQHLINKPLTHPAINYYGHLNGITLDHKIMNRDKQLTGIYSTLVVPTHETINADGGDYPAVKSFPYLTQSNSRAQMNIVFKEMKWDVGSDNPADIIAAPAGTALTLKKGDLIRPSGFNNTLINGLVIILRYDFSSSFIASFWDGFFIDSNNKLRNPEGAIPYYLEIWDGNGWGDDNKFQITNNVSTLQDDNNQTVLYGQKSIKLPNFLD